MHRPQPPGGPTPPGPPAGYGHYPPPPPPGYGYYPPPGHPGPHVYGPGYGHVHPHRRRIEPNGPWPARVLSWIAWVIAGLALVVNAMAAYDSESAGVEMAYLAIPLLGLAIGCRVGAQMVRYDPARRRKVGPCIGVGFAFAFGFLIGAFVFFEGIFPGL